MFDVRPDHRGDGLRLDITDRAACSAACVGMDAVLHLAADPSPAADFRSVVLPVNMVGTYNMVEASLAAGSAGLPGGGPGQRLRRSPRCRPIRLCRSVDQ